MRFSHWMALVLIFMLGTALPLFLGSDISAKINQQNGIYTSYAKSATNAAMAEAAQNTTDGLMFSSADVRQKVVDTYYGTLIKCFNYDYSSYKDMVKYYTPCIFLIDNDGYYIEYSADYTASERGQSFAAVSDVITTINKWSSKYGDYYVEFHLDDTVTVIYKDSSYTGSYKNVYKKLGEPAELRTSEYDERPNFADTENFSEDKQEYIINQVQNKLEYYVNLHSEFFNNIGNQQYTFTLPKITGEDWGRMLDMPTVIGFLQGKETEYNGTLFNVYSFTGHEITEVIKYFITKDESTGDLTYHNKSHLEALGKDPEEYIAYTMEDAAKKGASPCDSCILSR